MLALVGMLSTQHLFAMGGYEVMPVQSDTPEEFAQRVRFDELGNNGASETCSLGVRCGAVTMNWHKLLIGADIADALVQTYVGKNEKNFAKISVVDAGFDRSQKDALVDSSIKLKKSYFFAGDASKDYTGHGTAVTDIINDTLLGLTSTSKMTMFKITKNKTLEISDVNKIGSALRKACSKSDVVNASFAITGKSGDAMIELLGNDLAEIKKKGCLVVFGAGNDGIKKGFANDIDLESPLLFVEGLNSFADQAVSSSQGEISAPGDNIYSLVSSQFTLPEEKKSRSCNYGSLTYAPFSGTSFATPVVTAVAGQVVSVLKARKMLPKQADKRIKQIKSILIASSQISRSYKSNGMVNAVAAVTIAAGIEKYTSNIDKLKSIAAKKVQKICQMPNKNCASQSSCSDKTSCIAKLRFKSLMCDQKNSDDTSLFKGLYKLEEFELINALLNNSLTIGSQSVRGYFNNTWNRNLLFGDVDKVNNLSKAVETIESALHVGSRELITYGRFMEMVRSTGFTNTYLFEQKFGAKLQNGGKEELAVRIVNIFKKFPELDQTLILENLANGKYEYMEVLYGEIGFFYVLNRFKNDLSLKVAELMNRRLKKIVTAWLHNDLDVGIRAYSSYVPINLFLYNTRVVRNVHQDVKHVIGSELTDHNAYLYLFMLSTSGLLDRKTYFEYGNDVFDMFADSNLNGNAEIVEQSLRAIMKFGPQDNNKIKGFLRKNSWVILPDAFYDSTQVSNIHKSLGSDPSFWKDFYRTNLEGMNDVFDNPEDYDYLALMRPIANFFWAIQDRNIYVDSADVIKQNREELIELLKLSIAVSMNDYASGSYRANAIKILEYTIHSIDAFESAREMAVLQKGFARFKNYYVNGGQLPAVFERAVRLIYNL